MVALTRKRKAVQEQAAEPATQALSASAAAKRQKLPVRSKDGKAPAQKPAGQGTLITFNDEGKTDKELVGPAPTSEALAPSKAGQEGSEGSDDDAAPEAVSTAQAASEVKKSAQAVQKAAREQAAAEKRRRRERDALLKKQAEGRRKPGKEAKATAQAQGSDHDAPSSRHPDVGGGRKRADKIPIPRLLPAELLTDSSSEDEDAEDSPVAGADSPRPRKRSVAGVERWLSRQERGPRDARVGSTVFRVAKTADERLAPKAKKHAKSFKDLLRRRNRTAARPRLGFLANR